MVPMLRALFSAVTADTRTKALRIEARICCRDTFGLARLEESGASLKPLPRLTPRPSLRSVPSPPE